MRLRDLRDWVNDLPEDLMDIELVYRKIQIIPPDEEDSNEYVACEDSPLATAIIDTENGEACFLDLDSSVILENWESDGELENEEDENINSDEEDIDLDIPEEYIEIEDEDKDSDIDEQEEIEDED